MYVCSDSCRRRDKYYQNLNHIRNNDKNRTVRMKIRKFSSIIVLASITILTFYNNGIESCSCLPRHPQTHFCNADYVVQLRVLRKSKRLVERNIVYKIQVKKSYKLNDAGHITLQHDRLVTPDSSAICGVQLDVGKVYVIAGRGNYLSMCDYVNEYIHMSVFERRGFSRAYREGCKCNINPCFGSDCLQHSGTIEGCKWSPFGKCATSFSACMPATYQTVEGSIARCHWRRTTIFNDCMQDP